ncbi:MAG: hypothetical protein Q8K65_01875 [Alphaproteobacteria bacterium]|nr:hypothetical protein [Alphaproteobacteria bacterium]
MTDSNLPPESSNTDAPETAETKAGTAAAAQKAADRHTATRKVYDDISSPYDKPSLNAQQRKTYERKVLNIGLVLIMIVITGIGIAAHRLISGIDSMFGDTSVEFQLPETPFSPAPKNTAPVPPPQPPQPTRMNLPDKSFPTADPAMRVVMARITDVSGGIDTANNIFEETVISIRFLIPETGQICSLRVPVPAHAAEPQGETIQVTYNAETPSEELCASARVVFAPE